MDAVMVMGAQEHRVAQIGRTAVRPRADVVRLAPGCGDRAPVGLAAGSCGSQRDDLGGREQAGARAHVQHLGPSAQDERDDPCVAGEPSGFAGAHRCRVGVDETARAQIVEQLSVVDGHQDGRRRATVPGQRRGVEVLQHRAQGVAETCLVGDRLDSLSIPSTSWRTGIDAARTVRSARVPAASCRARAVHAVDLAGAREVVATRAASTVAAATSATGRTARTSRVGAGMRRSRRGESVQDGLEA